MPKTTEQVNILSVAAFALGCRLKSEVIDEMNAVVSLSFYSRI